MDKAANTEIVGIEPVLMPNLFVNYDDRDEAVWW